MNYFYDIKINLCDENLYEFYEWKKSDNIEHIKKIPIFLVSTQTMKDFIKYKPVVEEKFLKELLNQTKLCNSNKIKYLTIIADSKTVLAIEFNDKGETICKSKLLLHDELNILEIIYNFKKTNINYTVVKEKNYVRTVLRQEEEIKKFLNIEIETLYKNKDLLKLRYLYYELFNKENNDIEQIYNELNKKIKSDLDKKNFKLYEIIRLSYKTR